MSDKDKSIEERLGAILSDPNAMNTIMGIVKGLNGPQSRPGNNENPSTENSITAFDQEALPVMIPHKAGFNNNNKSLALLLALKPFLSQERAHKLDTLTGLLQVLSLTDFFK